MGGSRYFIMSFRADVFSRAPFKSTLPRSIQARVCGFGPFVVDRSNQVKCRGRFPWLLVVSVLW
jgi:hypothetical protein